MINRNTHSPILLATLLSIATSPAFLSHAEPGVPSNDTATNATPAAAAAPVAPAAIAPADAASSTPSTTLETPGARPATYTVVAGDSLWLIAHKFHCSVTSLQKINNLTTKNLKPGQVLKIPPAKKAKTKSTTTPAATPATPAAPATPPTTTTQPKSLTHHKDKQFVQAQPVQDFDIPASTFASCPVPNNSSYVYEDPTPTTASAPAKQKAAPVAELISPVDIDADAAAHTPVTTPNTPTPETTALSGSTFTSTQPETKSESVMTPSLTSSTASHPSFSASSKQMSRSSTGTVANPNPLFTTPSDDWGNRFMAQARDLASRGIEYDGEWRPPGEAHSWEMDCSNTSRYLYKATTGIQLPRTASDQYYYLHLQDKAWDIPEGTSDVAECDLLREKLKPGDLLFWENTYRPERQPPITHVMVFLGTNEKGQWIMAGSQESRGEHNRSGGGPDIYVFDPTKPCGGYTTWLGFVHHRGRFCAYGRPLDADPSKLSVATNN